MSSNRGVVYLGQGKVEVQSIDYPKMVDPRGRQIGHGVILKVVTHQYLRVGPAYGARPHDRRGRPCARATRSPAR